MSKLKDYSNIYELHRKNLKRMLPLLIVELLLIGFLSAVFITGEEPLFLLLPAILLIIVIIVSFSFHRTSKKVLTYFTQEELTRIDRAIPSIQLEDGFGVTEDALICGRGGLIYPVKNILWVYKREVTTNLYRVIPVNRNSYVVVIGKDHKGGSCKVRNNVNIIEFLQRELQQYRKGIFFGYSNELDTLYRQDFNKMVSMSEEYERQNSPM